MADYTSSKPATSSAPTKAKSKGSILLADEMLIHRKPVQERSGAAWESVALEMFNEKTQADYVTIVEDAKRRGINPNMMPKPKLYTPENIFASKLIKDEVAGDRVGIVLTDSKKFYYKL